MKQTHAQKIIVKQIKDEFDVDVVFTKDGYEVMNDHKVIRAQVEERVDELLADKQEVKLWESGLDKITEFWDDYGKTMLSIIAWVGIPLCLIMYCNKKDNDTKEASDKKEVKEHISDSLKNDSIKREQKKTVYFVDSIASKEHAYYQSNDEIYSSDYTYQIQQKLSTFSNILLLEDFEIKDVLFKDSSYYIKVEKGYCFINIQMNDSLYHRFIDLCEKNNEEKEIGLDNIDDDQSYVLCVLHINELNKAELTLNAEGEKHGEDEVTANVIINSSSYFIMTADLIKIYTSK